MNGFKTLREQADLTLDEVENKTGINKTKLSRVELGKVQLTPCKAYLLKRILILEIARKNGDQITE